MGFKAINQLGASVIIINSNHKKEMRRIKLSLLGWLSPFGFKLDNTEVYSISFTHKELDIVLLPKVLGKIDVCCCGVLVFSDFCDNYDNKALSELMSYFGEKNDRT